MEGRGGDRLSDVFRAKRLVQEFIQRLCIHRSRTCLRFVGYPTEAGKRVVFGAAVWMDERIG